MFIRIVFRVFGSLFCFVSRSVYIFSQVSGSSPFFYYYICSWGLVRFSFIFVGTRFLGCVLFLVYVRFLVLFSLWQRRFIVTSRH